MSQNNQNRVFTSKSDTGNLYHIGNLLRLLCKGQCMNKIEKFICVAYWPLAIIYIPFFFTILPQYSHILIFLHLSLMAFGLLLLIVIIRDIYKRDFPNPNTKVTWTILTLMFWPSIFVYLYKYGFRPR